MSRDGFITHATRAALVAERGHALFEDLAEVLKQTALELIAEGKQEEAKGVAQDIQTFSDWYNDYAETTDALIHDYIELERTTHETV